jgi:cell division protein YceG involved in septum cleavage
MKISNTNLDIKKINFNFRIIIKIFLKLIKHSFLLTIIILLLIFLFLGFFFYKYIFIIEQKEPDINKSSVLIDETKLNNVLLILKEKGKVLDEVDLNLNYDVFGN